AERVVRGLGLPRSRQGVEEGGLADVGQSDDSGAQHWARQYMELRTPGDSGPRRDSPERGARRQRDGGFVLSLAFSAASAFAPSCTVERTLPVPASTWISSTPLFPSMAMSKE